MWQVRGRIEARAVKPPWGRIRLGISAYSSCPPYNLVSLNWLAMKIRRQFETPARRISEADNWP